MRAVHARRLPRRGIEVSWPRLDLAPMGNTLPQNNNRERRHEIRHLLRAAAATPMGRARPAQALPECPDAARDRRPLRLRPRLGGGTSFSGRIFAFAFA